MDLPQNVWFPLVSLTDPKPGYHPKKTSEALVHWEFAPGQRLRLEERGAGGGRSGIWLPVFGGAVLSGWVET